MPAHGTPTVTPGRQWVLLILGGLVTVLVVVAAFYVVFTPKPANTPEADTNARPVPSAAPSPAPVAPPTATVAPGTPKPGSCDEIYSPAMKDAFAEVAPAKLVEELTIISSDMLAFILADDAKSDGLRGMR